MFRDLLSCDIVRGSDERCYGDVLGCEWRTVAGRLNRIIGERVGYLTRHVDPSIRFRRVKCSWMCDAMGDCSGRVLKLE